MISNQIIEEIRNKIDIVAVISEYVKLRKTGKNYVGLCPFHSEKSPSFTVSPEKQLFHCFGCGEGGNLFTFFMKMENISFGEAVKELASRIGISVSEDNFAKSKKTEKEKLYEVMLLAAKFFRKCLEESVGEKARNYLAKRGISSESAKLFQLGFAPDGWDNLFKFLISRGVAPDLIETAGLTLPREEKGNYYDRFRNRLIFPIFDLRGRVIAFSGRTLSEEEPKYLNSPETLIFRKGENFYGLNLSKEKIKEAKYAILVEGNLDLISVFQAGITNIIAPLGTSLTLTQCKLITRFTQNVVLAFDTDAAGEAAAERAIELLRDQDLKVKIAVLTEAKDPDEFIHKFGVEAFKKAVATSQPYLEFKIRKVLTKRNLTEIEERAAAVKEIAKILVQEKDSFVQKEYAKFAANLLKLELDILLTEIKRENYLTRTKKDLRWSTEKPPSKIFEAEKKLIAFSFQGKEALETIKREISPEEFISPEAKFIINLLFSIKEEDRVNFSHFLLEKITEEKPRRLLTQILVSEEPQYNEKIILDCIQTIKKEHRKNRVAALRAELEKAERAGETKKAAELLAALKNEAIIGEISFPKVR